VTYRATGFPPERFEARVDRFKSVCRAIGKLKDLSETGEWIDGRETKVELTDQQWFHLAAALEESRFWDLEPRDDLIGMDGEWWRLEGVKAGHYYSVRRWYGGEIGDACQLLSQYAGIKRC
jgi:hypothetical protein